MPHRPLDRPPVVEALLDFRVRPREADDDLTDHLDAAADAMRGEYPNEIDRRDRDLPEHLRRVLPAASFWSGGKRFRSEDGRRTVLISNERLTFSLTFRPPAEAYTHWATLEDAAFAAWEAYEQATQPVRLLSLATRFVNRIEGLPDQPAGVFTSPPDLPIPEVTLTSYNDRRSGRTLDGYGVRVGRRLDTRVGAPAAVLFFDVEAFKTYDAEAPTPPIRSDDLTRDLGRLRELKNDLFHGSLTPATLNRYRDAAL